jgi:hypothetical protein
MPIRIPKNAYGAHTEKKDFHILGTRPAGQIRGLRCSLRFAACFTTFFAGLVVFAERLNPIPSRTRPLNFPAPMVLSLKAWKSRSLPGLQRTLLLLNTMIDFKRPPAVAAVFFCGVHSPAVSMVPGIACRPQRRDAPAKRFWLFGEEPAGQSCGRFQVRVSARFDQRRQP